MTVRRYVSAADADRDDPAYWRNLTDAERVLQVWRLRVEQWRLRGEWTDESRFVGRALHVDSPDYPRDSASGSQRLTASASAIAKTPIRAEYAKNTT